MVGSDGRRRSGAGAAAFGLLACLALTGSTTPPDGSAVIDRVPRDPRITESSGLTPSLNHPGVLWTHNDSGNPPVLYALRRDGSTAAAVEVEGVANLDWEAIAGYRDPDGRAMLAIGDIGDNAAHRPWIEIVLLAEPALRSARVRPLRRLRLRYPKGGVDAETLLVDPQARRMYVVTKGLGSTIYEVPAAVWPGTGARPVDSGTLVPRATVSLIMVTDGVIAAGGHPLLRTYGELALLPPVPVAGDGGGLRPLSVVRLPLQSQGEGLALVDGRTVLLSSEGVGQPILRLPLPPEIAAVLRPPAAAVPATARATSSRGLVLALVGASGVLFVLGAIRLRRHSRGSG